MQPATGSMRWWTQPLSSCLKGSLLAVILMLTCLSVAWSQQLEVIDLHNRTAAEVLPVLQPLVESGGALTGQDYKLFARVSKANLAQLRQALASIDRQPRSLLISVRNATRQDIEREQVGVAAQVGQGRGSVSVLATESGSTRQGEGVASVRVLEGNAASIANGQSVPVVTSVLARGGSRPLVAGTLEYRQLSSGYLVTPRVNGESVTLQIDQQSQRAGDRGGIATQSLSTQASGRLGAWIELGGVTESGSTTSSTLGGRSFSTQSDQRSVWVKVELAD
jgi:type II secretory pathway component GspD/PulD (secretin)